MLHRFSNPDLGISSHNPTEVKQVLEHLRHHKYELVSVAVLLDRLKGRGHPLRRTVVFTMDDGYADHAIVGAPLFAAFDCPITTFVVTGFVSGQLWL